MTDYSQLATDTIAAIATAPGRGGIGIIRLSGPLALSVGEALCRYPLEPRRALYCSFQDTDGEVIDSGIALYFPKPNSFTGEDVVELQGHGGPAVLELLLSNCCQQGARLATAGEFSQRAYLNDKMDLTQAEAIADLINATTELGVRSASRSLQGAFSREINQLIEQLVNLRIYIEAAIDFPEEEIDFIAQGQVAQRLLDLREQLQRVADTAQQGRIIRDGMKLVIAGKPNAGKSSLLNALSGEDTAIVTPIEGTTRDVLREHIQIDGMPLHIVDTAGLRDSVDIVEREGINRAWHEMQSADHILLVIDDSRDQPITDLETLWPEFSQHLPKTIPVTLIHNKCDLSGREPSTQRLGNSMHISLSAKKGSGMDLLRSYLKACMGYSEKSEHGFIARRRHIDALASATKALDQGIAQLQTLGAAELVAEDLRQCHDALGEITGGMSSDELLGAIFSSFCIGK